MSLLKKKTVSDPPEVKTTDYNTLERLLISQIEKLSFKDIGLNSRVKRTLVRR